MSDTMHSAAELLWESQNAQAESAYMDAQQKRAETLLAALAESAYMDAQQKRAETLLAALAESAYMDAQQKRAETLLAALAAIAGGVDHAISRGTQLRAVVAITNEVERHAGAIDPRETTAVSVLVDLVVELAGGMRHLANVMIKDDQPAARDYPVEGPEWPASLMDPEVRS